MTKHPVLTLPEINKQFIIGIDALGIDIGAVLMQKRHLIAYINKSLRLKQ